MSDVWTTVHAERAALIEDLESLAAADWDHPSLCAGWSVHDVAAHLLDTALTTRLGFIAGMVRVRGDFDRLNQIGVRRHRGATPAATLAGLRRAARRTTTPPAPLVTRIVEEIVHGEDIRRPLGIVRNYPTDAVVRALTQQLRTSPSFGGAKDLLPLVRLVATDTDYQAGDGPEVRGPALALLLVSARRRAGLAELEGPGLAALTAAL